jgi:hypothetical protein
VGWAVRFGRRDEPGWGLGWSLVRSWWVEKMTISPALMKKITISPALMEKITISLALMEVHGMRKKRFTLGVVHEVQSWWENCVEGSWPWLSGRSVMIGT